MGAGIVVVKAAREPFAAVDGEIKLELIAGTRRRIGPIALNGFAAGNRVS